MFFIGYTISLVFDRILFDPKIFQEDNAVHPGETTLIQINEEDEKGKEKEISHRDRDHNTSHNLHSPKKGESPEKKREHQEKIFKKIFSKTERIASFAENQFISSFIGELHHHVETNETSVQNHQIFREIFDEGRNSYSQDFIKRERTPICNQKHLTTFLLLSTLSIQSFLFGISLGILEDLHEIIYMISILTFYKLVESVALGISLGKSNIEREIFIILTLIFALTKPTGILFGVLLEDFQLLRGIFLALIGGTTLYISTSEAIIEEFAISQYKYHKYLGFLCGVLVNTTVISIGWMHCKTECEM